jgi:hypothetical protein
MQPEDGIQKRAGLATLELFIRTYQRNVFGVNALNFDRNIGLG